MNQKAGRIDARAGHGRVTGADHRGYRLRVSISWIRRFVFALGLVFALTLPAPVPAAQANDAPSVIVSSLTGPAGLLVDPVGRLWVSDAQQGFCRVTEASGAAAGAIEPSTCLGGASSGNAGPTLPGAAVVVDPTGVTPDSGDEMALIPDTAAGSSEVTRAAWSPSSKTFAYSSKLTLIGADLRPTAVSVDADGDAYVIFDRSRAVVRIVDPTSTQPGLETVAYVSSLPPRAIAVGAMNSGGRSTVYVAEPTGLMEFLATKPGNLATTVPIESYAVGTPSRLAFDSATSVLYAGTSAGTVASQDSMTRVDTKSGTIVPEWVTGLTRIGAVAVRHGQVLVAEDPAQIAVPLVAGEGIVTAIRPAPLIVSGPGAAGATTSTNNPTPTFGVATVGGESMQCTFDAASAGSQWGECSGGSYTARAPLADGPHTFAVRFGQDGAPEEAAFIVDTASPSVSASPGGGTFSTGEKVKLSASEPSTIYYTTDGSTPTSGARVYNLPVVLNRSMTLKYVAVDTAGNISAAGYQTYTVGGSSIPSSHDFNGDEEPDVLSENNGGALWLYPGNGNGGWLPWYQVGSGWNGMTAITVAGDFNGDGHADLLARDGAGLLWLYPGDGSSAWLPRTLVGSGWNAMTLILGGADFNSDTYPDVLARDGSGSLWLYPGDGSGAWFPRVQVGSGWNVMTAIVTAGDFDGDTNPDVLARDASGLLWLYRGDGSGAWRPRVLVGSGWNVMTAIVGSGDFNGDNRSDVLGRDVGGDLWLYPGSGSGGWLSRSQIGAGWGGMAVIL